MRASWLLLLVLVSCTSFEDIGRNVCGNGLVETGEDCDSSAASCVRCAVTCDDAADCPTDAYACGTDGTCHAPSGVLDEAVPAGPFQVDHVAISDLDHDGIGDAMGVSPTSIAVRYGDPAGRLTRSDSVLTPSHSAAPAFGDLDGDGSTDIAFSSPDGLVAYGSRFSNLAPLAVRSALTSGTEVDDLDIRTIFSVGKYGVALFAVNTTADVALLAVLDFVGGYSYTLPCGARVGEVTGAELDLTSLDVYRLSDLDVVVSLFIESTPRKLCVMSMHRPGIGDEWTFTDVTPPTLVAPTRKVTIADLDVDADKCPGIVSMDGGPNGLRYWKGTTVGGQCSLVTNAGPNGAALPPTKAAAGSVVVGRLPLDPGFPFFSRDMLVLSDGVYGYNTLEVANFAKLYASQRSIGGVDHADLDDDGEVDGVLVAANEDDVDILYRRPNAALPFLPGYIVYRVDTASKVSLTRIGDYNGDRRLDLAMIEQIADYDRLIVAYGADSFLQPPQTMGTFDGVLTMTTLAFPTSEDPAGVTDDMFVLQPPTPGRTGTSLSLLVGSPLGTMVSFFDPRIDDDNDDTSDRDLTVITSVVAGRFTAQSATASGIADLLAIGAARSDSAPRNPQVWAMPGTESGPDATELPALTINGLSDCARSVGTGLCVADAIVTAWPVSSTADAVLAVDRESPPHAVSFDPQAAAPITATVLTTLVDALTGKASPRSLQRADLDGDGADELIVVATARGAQAGTSAILVCQMAGPVPTSCRDLLPEVLAAAPTVTTCVDATPARITPRDWTTTATASRDLVIACREAMGSSLYRVALETPLALTVLAQTPSNLTAVRAGDVTGDGVDDVLAIEGASGVQSLVVFPQCGSRDAASCGGAQ